MSKLSKKILLKKALDSYQSNDLTKTIGFLKKVLEEDPNEIEALELLVLVYQQQERLTKACQILKRIINLQPRSPNHYLNLANLLGKLNLYSEAKENYMKALSLDDLNANIYNSFGVLLYQKGDFESAKKLFIRTLEIESIHPQAMYNLALTLIKTGSLEKAIKILTTNLDIVPENYRTLFLLAKTYLKVNKTNEATDCFKRLQKLAQKDLKIAESILNNLLENDYYKYAKPFAYDLYKVEPKNIAVIYNLGVIADRELNYSEAKYYYKLVISKDPHHFASLNNLGYLYLRENRRKKAQDYFKQALELSPNDPSLKYSLAILGGKNEKYKSAPLEYLRNLFDNYADHFDIHITQSLDYKLPDLVLEELQREGICQKKLNILDLGCGTGLCGVLLKPFAKKLTGVDLSAKMLAKAYEKNCYDILQTAENIDFLSQSSDKFDLILAVDVFVYLGSLHDILFVCKKSLKESGKILFTTEICNNTDYKLQSSGRFAHSYQYVEEKAYKLHLKIASHRIVNSRRQKGGKLFSAIYILSPL